MPQVFATLDPTHLDANASLSGGNLSLTQNSDTPAAGCLANQGKSSGKWYWEVYQTSGGANRVRGAGIANYSFPLNSIPGAGCDGQGGVNGKAFWESGGAGTSYTQCFVDAGIGFSDSPIGCMLDLDGGTYKIKVDGNEITVATGLTGTWYPLLFGYRTPSVITANFGASAFSLSVPGGFNAGVFEGTPSNDWDWAVSLVGLSTALQFICNNSSVTEADLSTIRHSELDINTQFALIQLLATTNIGWIQNSELDNETKKLLFAWFTETDSGEIARLIAAALCSIEFKKILLGLTHL